MGEEEQVNGLASEKEKEKEEKEEETHLTRKNDGVTVLRQAFTYQIRRSLHILRIHCEVQGPTVHVLGEAVT